MKAAIKSDFRSRVRTASFWGDRLRDWTAWIASMLRMRPFTSGPRLSRGPHRTVNWGLLRGLWVGYKGGDKERTEWREEAIDSDGDGLRQIVCVCVCVKLRIS